MLYVVMALYIYMYIVHTPKLFSDRIAIMQKVSWMINYCLKVQKNCAKMFHRVQSRYIIVPLVLYFLRARNFIINHSGVCR